MIQILPYDSLLLFLLFLIILFEFCSSFISLVYIKMFSNNEYVENHLLLGKCRNNATSAAVISTG
jgi:hypothetical protein